MAGEAVVILVFLIILIAPFVLYVVIRAEHDQRERIVPFHQWIGELIRRLERRSQENESGASIDHGPNTYHPVRCIWCYG